MLPHPPDFPCHADIACLSNHIVCQTSHELDKGSCPACCGRCLHVVDLCLLRCHRRGTTHCCCCCDTACTAWTQPLYDPSHQVLQRHSAPIHCTCSDMAAVLVLLGVKGKSRGMPNLSPGVSQTLMVWQLWQCFSCESEPLSYFIIKCSALQTFCYRLIGDSVAAAVDTALTLRAKFCGRGVASTFSQGGAQHGCPDS